MHETPEQNSDVDPRLTVEGTFALLGLAAEIGWEMIWVKGFPMPKIRRNVVTQEPILPVDKAF